MIAWFSTPDRRRGFSLIELAAAGAVMAALIGIAVVTFNAVNQSKYETQAEVNLHRVLTAERAYYTAGNGRYTDMSGGENPVPSRAPEELSYTNAASTAPDEISVATGADSNGIAGQLLGLAVQGSSSGCWLLWADATGATIFEKAPEAAACTGATALGLG